MVDARDREAWNAATTIDVMQKMLPVLRVINVSDAAQIILHHISEKERLDGPYPQEYIDEIFLRISNIKSSVLFRIFASAGLFNEVSQTVLNVLVKTVCNETNTLNTFDPDVVALIVSASLKDSSDDIIELEIS